MNWRSPRFLFLAIILVLAVGSGAVALTLAIRAGHATVPVSAGTHKTVIPGNERQVVQTYNQAAIKQDWATLYTTTSKITTGDATEAQFEQMMTQQAQAYGTISSITITSSPAVKTNPDGIIYFTIHEQVTMVKHGTSQTQSMISLYILEDGVWRYWFSKKA
jgi:hypothetical protein